MAIFKGFVKLSQKNYELLKKTGTLTLGDKTITYEPKTTFYITPYVPPVAGAGGGNSNVDLSEYVKFTDFAGNSKPGVVDVRAFFGMIVDSYGRIQTVKATDDEIKAKTNEYHALVSKNIDLVVKTGLTTNALEWSDDDKKAARTLIGATNLNTHMNYGIQNNNTGLMMIVKATNDEILKRSTTYKPIVPTNLDYAVAQGLIGKKIETTNEDGSVTTTYEHDVELSADEQQSAREFIGVNIATGTNVGLVKINAEKGTLVEADGTVVVYQASNYDIEQRKNLFKPITPYNLDYAVKKSFSDNKLTGDAVWTDTEKRAARALIGAVGNTEYATYNTAGVVITNASLGAQTSQSGYLTIVKAEQSEITAKENNFKPIVPSTIDYAVKAGLIGEKTETENEDGSVTTSYTHSLTLDDNEKTSVNDYLGSVQRKYKTMNNGVHCVYGIDGHSYKPVLFEVDSTGTKYYHLVRQKENGRIAVGNALNNNEAVNLGQLNSAIAGLGTVFDLKGTKATVNDLPTEGNEIGDVWYVVNESVGYIWLNDGTSDKWEKFGAPIDLSGYAEKTALDSYLPLTAGSGKKLTGTLYANTAGIIVGKDSSSANNTKGIVFGENGLTRIGASSSLGIYAERNIYLRPGLETDANAGVALSRTALYPTTDKSMSLGGSSNYFNNIYGTTIYQNGKQVANKEDMPTNNNQLTNGAGYVTASGSVASATKATQDSDGNAINTTYLKLSGGTVGSLAFDSVGKGLTFKTKDGVEYFIYGDGSNYSRLYIQLKDKDGNYQWYPLVDENGKLYSGKTEVAVKGDIPTNNNQLTNGAGYVTSSGSVASATKATQDGNGNVISRIYTAMIPAGTAIIANKDLNAKEFIKIGNYYCSANVTVETLINCPTTSAFMMQVYSPLGTAIDNEDKNAWVYRLRKLTTFTGDEYFQLVYSADTVGTFIYGNWVKTAKTTDMPTNNNQLTNGAGYITASGMTNESNTNYIRFANGFQICWGVISGSNESIRTITLTKPFKDTNYEVLINTGNQNSTLQLTGKHLSCSSKTTTTFQTWTTSAAFYNRYVAFGMWK